MFMYTVNAFLDEKPFNALPIFKSINLIQDLRIKSKSFDSYKECVDASVNFLDDIIYELQQLGYNYTFFVDQHPDFISEDIDEFQQMSGTGALSDWHKNQLLKFYLVENSIPSSSRVHYTRLVISIFSVEQHNLM